MASSEIREWLTSIGLFLAGAGAIVAALRSKRKADASLKIEKNARRRSKPLPLTPEIRKQWDRSFSCVLVGAVSCVISFIGGMHPHTPKFMQIIFPIVGLILLGAYIWIAIRIGQRAILLHQEQAIEEYAKDIQKKKRIL